MKTIFCRCLSLIAAGVLLLGLAANAQTVENTDFRLSNDFIYITYDIVDYAKNDYFTVDVNIVTSSGHRIPASAFSGSYGVNVPGGSSKQIIWNLKEDQISLNEPISVEVIIQKQDGKILSISEIPPGSHTFLFNTLLPGLGTSRLGSGSEAQWSWGIVGYGMVGSAVFFRLKAVDFYDQYKANFDIIERDELYEKTQRNRTISTICLAGAAIVWSGNWIQGFSKTRQLKEKAAKAGLANVTLKMGFDNYSQTPLLGLQWRF